MARFSMTKRVPAPVKAVFDAASDWKQVLDLLNWQHAAREGVQLRGP
jgi:hypothetical protein